ncbi:MAG: hypothetical protein MZV70_11380 [Desulfobacterales bacterium]|nr:hypothetical protein [Desulfobacterales bacterium]
MGAKDDLNDSDSAVKPYSRQLIVMSRAFKYALIAPLAALAIGIGSHSRFEDYGAGLIKALKDNTIGS